MRNVAMIARLFACSIVFAPVLALADTVGTGTRSITFPSPFFSSFTGTDTYDNASFTPFGVPINLGTAVGTADVAGSACCVDSGTFVADSVAAGALSYHQAGDYICASTGCWSGAAVSYVSELSNVAGSALSDLLGDIVYTFDGSVHYDGVGFFSGIFGINAFQLISTPEGQDITSSVTTTFFNSATGQQVTAEVDVTADVSAAGSTVITAFSNAAGAVPPNFAVSANGYNAFFFDVTTTATLTPPITVCQHYPDSNPDDGYVDGTNPGLDETTLKILHLESGTFTDVTTSLDTTNNVICGQTSSLSPFVVAVSVPANVDHFTCYKAGATKGSIKFAGIPIQSGIILTDQWGPSLLEVKKPQFLCAPTDKNFENPGADTHPEHLKAYQLKLPHMVPPVSRTNLTIVDQFNQGGLLINAKKQSYLLVPTVKSLTGPTPVPTPPAFSTDHFECYKASPAKGALKFQPVLALPIKDQFGTMTVDVKKPMYLCNPTDKNGEDPTAPAHVDHLMCYQIKQVDLVPFVKRVGVFVNNQFGPETLDVKKPALLCVPALKNP